MASRATDFEDCYLLVEEALHNVSKQVEGKIRKPPKIDAENSNVQAPFSLPEQFANCTGFKKKEKSNGGHMKIGTVLYICSFVQLCDSPLLY